MTRIILDDVESMQDLYDALAVVTHTFLNPEKFSSAEERFSRGAADACKCDQCVPAEAIVREPIAAPMPYLPCPNQGTHLRLVDCWACWCDVDRGAWGLPRLWLTPDL